LGFPRPQNGPPDGGVQFFGGGNVASATLTQTVDLGGMRNDGTVPYRLSGWLGGFLEDPSEASVTVTFFDVNHSPLGTGKIGPVAVLDRRLKTVRLERETTGTIPALTRNAQVVVTLKDRNPVIGNYNNAYADNISFTVGPALPPPPPPTPPLSKVGPLEH